MSKKKPAAATVSKPPAARSTPGGACRTFLSERAVELDLSLRDVLMNTNSATEYQQIKAENGPRYQRLLEKGRKPPTRRGTVAEHIFPDDRISNCHHQLCTTTLLCLLADIAFDCVTSK